MKKKLTAKEKVIKRNKAAASKERKLQAEIQRIREILSRKFIETPEQDEPFSWGDDIEPILAAITEQRRILYRSFVGCLNPL